MSKSRHYCATFFKRPEEKLPDNIKYVIHGQETCPTTNKTHWQSYIELTKPMRIKAVKTLFNDNTIHLESRKGSRDQARNYCKKDNNYIELGEWTLGQGHRTDLKEIVASMSRGAKLTDIMIEHPQTYCQYRNGLKDIASAITKKSLVPFRQVEVILLTGPTGCGKTRLAMTEATYKIQACNMKWWQDYDQDTIICIDEYNNNVRIDELFALLDGYELRLNVKSSHTYAAWTKVYITTNLKVHQIHQHALEEHRNALFRRITQIREFWDEVP